MQGQWERTTEREGGWVGSSSFAALFSCVLVLLLACIGKAPASWVLLSACKESRM